MPDGDWRIPALQEICRRLLDATASSRTTVRLVDGDGAVRLAAEEVAEGVASMADGPQPAVAAAPTYRYLEATRSCLYQSDTRNEPPAPPPSLVEHYRVLAQMLAPVEVGGAMVATVSVHQQARTRLWTGADRAALDDAAAEVTAWCSVHHRGEARR